MMRQDFPLFRVTMFMFLFICHYMLDKLRTFVAFRLESMRRSEEQRQACQEVELSSVIQQKNCEISEARATIATLQDDLEKLQGQIQQLQNSHAISMKKLKKLRCDLHEALHGHGLLSDVLRKKIAGEPWEETKAWLLKSGLSHSNVGLFLRESCLKNDSYRRAGREGKPAQKIP